MIAGHDIRALEGEVESRAVWPLVAQPPSGLDAARFVARKQRRIDAGGGAAPA